MKYWNVGRTIAFAQALLCLGAAVGYLLTKDYRRALYFFFAACITLSVAA